jgi:hypothetical protein
MAIQIVKNLVITPNPAALDCQCRFVQTLKSSKKSESFESTYSLNKPHNVWFVAPDGTLTKSVTRPTTVTSSNTEVEHRINVARGPGANVGLVTVNVTHASSPAVMDADMLRVQ